VITFPQISSICALTIRPIRTLRWFKLLSRSVIAECPVTFDEKNRVPGRGPISRLDDVTLPEPPGGLYSGFGSTEGQVVITWYRHLIPVLGATTFGDPPCDRDPAFPVQDAV